MSDGFYRAFEERYRGTRELIKLRLRVYLPFIEPLRTLYELVNVIDLGCGRGEWLELLHESNFDAQGIDLDAGMLAACRERRFNVQLRDAIGFLKEQPDASQAVISGFHIVEHISFSDLQTLVQESLRVLKPAGLLILETPNPENIMVGTSSFYLDPSHIRPVPAQLLSFIPEYYGFKRVKTLRLQEQVDLANNNAPTLFHVLSGVSPDYGIVAQKHAEPEQMNLFVDAFEKNYGLTLEELAQSYEKRIAKAEQAEATLEKFRKTLLWRVFMFVKNRVK